MIPTGVTRGRPNPLHSKFADRLRRSRKAAGLTASGLSLKAGLNKNAVGMFETLPGLPKLPTVEKLARALGLSPAWLAYGLGATAGGSPDAGVTVAERAKEARTLLGLSLRETARRARVTDGAVSLLESGSQPALDTLEQLAKALQVSPAWLAFGTSPRELPRRGAAARSCPAAPAPAP